MLATPAIVGACLAFAVGVLATVVRLDRDRAFYPTVAIVIASLYSLFAVMGGSTRALVIESMVGVGFIALAVFGFRTSLWVVAAALGLHGVADHQSTQPGGSLTSAGSGGGFTGDPNAKAQDHRTHLAGRRDPAFRR
jgi:hypothetical protein